MSNKFLLFFSLFFLLMNQIISSEDVIPKYGEKRTSAGYAYLDVSDFDSGDKIYISITTTDFYSNNRLGYMFCDNTNTHPSFFGLSHEYPSSSSEDYPSKTYHYKIKKDNSNSKYLYMEYSFIGSVTIENTENDGSLVIIIIAVIFSVVFLVIIIIVIVCICRRCRNARLGAVPVPVVSGYGVSPYGVQPVMPMVQPVVVQREVNVQPYYNGVQQYNQVPPAPIGSDIRVNQNQNFEKPM